MKLEMQKSWTEPALDSANAIPVCDAESLISDNAVAQIMLENALYSLGVTRSYKLILTK